MQNMLNRFKKRVQPGGSATIMYEKVVLDKLLKLLAGNLALPQFFATTCIYNILSL